MGRVPRGLKENVEWRRRLVEACGKSGQLREAVKLACRRDILFYINAFAWTYDPESEPAVLPFITWPAQERAIEKIRWCIRHRKDLVIEKSRRQGGSWLSLLVMEWMWRFQGMKQFLMISRDLASADSASPDSLFWKVDFLHKNLPSWLRAKTKRIKGYVENEDNGSTMTVQASTEKAGIGGRATAMFIDEFSRIDQDEKVLDGTADTSRCRIFNSTHTGPGTAFYRLTERTNVEKLVLHWSENPFCNKGLYRWDTEKGRVEVLDKSWDDPLYKFVADGTPAGGPFPGLRSPWYDAECERRGNARFVAMNLDIDARGSMSQFFDSHIIRRLVSEYCCPAYWQGDVRFDADTGRPLGLESRAGGPLRLWLHLKSDGKPALGEFVFGGDIATGTGATPSCLSGVDCATGNKVAEYANANIDAKQLAFVAVALCWLFKDQHGEPAKMIWEQQGPGLVFGAKVLELGFRNVFFRMDELPITTSGKISSRPGWVPTVETTRFLLEEYRSALSMRQFINRSEEAMKECGSFRYTPRGDVEHSEMESKDDPTGARVNHGDRVIADALAWKLAKKRWQGEKEKSKVLQTGDVRCLAGRRAMAERAMQGALRW